MKEEKNKRYSVMGDEPFIEFLTDKFGGVNERLDKVEGRLDGVEKDISVLKEDIGVLKGDVGELKEGFGYLKNNMVTKEYLDRKLGELEGRLILIIRKGDERFNLLIEILVEKKAISPKDADKINSIELFPSLK